MKRRTFLWSMAGLCAAAGLSGAYYWPRRWQYIVVHHSGGNYGSIEFLQKVHRERQPKDPIDAIPYHYVIGNGNGLGRGEVASDWRKENHLWGAHVSGRNTKRNLFGIGICIIGNLEKHQILPEQYNALVTLTQHLMREYAIPAENVSGHGHTPSESTKCPGKHFPMEKFLSDIALPV